MNRQRLKCRNCGEPIVLEEENSFVIKVRILKFEKKDLKKSKVKCKRCGSWNEVDNLSLNA